MDLSIHGPTETFPYRHKKFDAYKRPRDDDAEEAEVMEQRTPHFVFNPLFYGAERVSTPYSNDSNCSSDYAGFASLFNASSTPSTKRRHLHTGASQYNPNEDSGISLTPQKWQKAQHRPQQRALKRTLKQSALAEEIAKKPRTASQHAATTTNINLDMGHKRPQMERFNKCNMTAVSAAQKCSNIKAALKPALKPTPAGTLELTTATTPSNAMPAAAATVLSRISEDKLRSICTYHGNMVRQFPKKERSPKDQERRNKNTIACRMSRGLKKLEHIAVEVQVKEHERQWTQMMEERLRVQTYMEQLAQLSSVLCKREVPEEEEVEIDVVSVHDDERCRALRGGASWTVEGDVGAQAQRQPMMFASPAAASVPIITSAYSIAYLMGSLRK